MPAQAASIPLATRQRRRLVASVPAALLVAVGARDTLGFVAAPAVGRPLQRVDSRAPVAEPLHLVDSRAPLVEASSNSSPNASAPGAAGLATFAFFSFVAGRLSTRRGGLRRRAELHVRRFFGGGDNKEQSDNDSEEELTARATAACEKLQTEIAELKTLVEEKQAAHERLTMEVNNFRTRTKKELAAARGKASIPVIKELIPIADEFDLAKQNLKVEGDGERAICDRFDALFNGMMATWKKLGVEKMTSVGEEFNPEFHEAVSMIPSDEYKADFVCNELRGGWVLKPLGSDEPQVLRPALVCVSAGPGPA
eukprot:CAMPEP_0117621326 /NCGR_PEP_ID=MMETSP0784-20121206/87578_1 /TAXON_ID=39447 /ORGANISM="" /LENGTH=310 /DNA_ID=CAMNT_0005425251 /DNA_START=77 /DNA_END=1009 /DNA_ORIENTATION=+